MPFVCLGYPEVALLVPWDRGRHLLKGNLFISSTVTYSINMSADQYVPSKVSVQEKEAKLNGIRLFQ